MATYYLPSSTTWYSTGNQYIFYRVVFSETIGSSRSFTATMQAYKSSSSTASTGSGNSSASLTVNGTALGTKSLSYLTIPADNSIQTIASWTFTLGLGVTSVPVSSNFTMPNVSVGSNTNSGTLSLSAITYTVSFNANGGSGAPAAQTKTYGTTLTLSSVKPTRSGYTFLGWSTSSTATSASYAAGGSYTANAAATLYAVWQAITYSVSYNMNGGEGSIPKQTYTYGGTNINLSSTIPTRIGYEFLGWSLDSNATDYTYYPNQAWSSKNGGNYTLYAVWKVQSYQVSFNASGGNVDTTSKTVTYASTYGDLPTPSKAAHIFLGWYTEASGGTEVISTTTVSTASDHTLYAVWEVQANCRIKENGSYSKLGMMYVKQNGNWKTSIVYGKSSGSFTNTTI